MDGVDRLKQNQPIGWQADTRASHYAVVDITCQATFNWRDCDLVGVDEADLGLPAPPCEITSATLIPAWIFSTVMRGGNAGSEKSTVAGSKPINGTPFIEPPAYA